jgi:hypothetical protein
LLGIDCCSYVYKVKGSNEEKNDGCLKSKPMIKHEEHLTITAEFDKEYPEIYKVENLNKL